MTVHIGPEDIGRDESDYRKVALQGPVVLVEGVSWELGDKLPLVDLGKEILVEESSDV